MKLSVMLFIACMAIFNCSRAQSSAEEKAIMEPVAKLFSGMSLGDSAMVRAAFTAQPTMMRVVKGKDAMPALRSDSFQKFLAAVGTPHAESWNEPIWDPVIKVDGNLAQVWVKFAFYAGKKFSHCGVDAFHLFKDKSGSWKIFHLVDTHQTEGCDVPKEVSDKFK